MDQSRRRRTRQERGARGPEAGAADGLAERPAEDSAGREAAGVAEPDVELVRVADLAEQKLEFVRDAVKFGIWTALALAFLFPVGVVMLIWGGPRRARRFSELYLEPPTRERLIRRELRKRTPRAGPARAAPRPPAREERVEEVHLAEVVESALDGLRQRFARDGVALERRLDGRGTLRGDAGELCEVLVQVLGRALDGLAESRTPEPRIEVEMGENLAGSAVWVRVRDNGPESGRPGLEGAERLVEARGGRLELAADPAGGSEVVVTLPRQHRR